MKIRTAAAVILALLLVPAAALSADDATTKGKPVAGRAQMADYVKGDQTIGLVIGLQLPLFIFDADFRTTSANMNPGASFSVSYQYFVTGGLVLGGTLSAAFNSTIANRSFFVAPLSFRTAYWWTTGALELGLGAEIGGDIKILDSHTVFGPFAKAGAMAGWRISNAWSAGLQCFYWFIPEIHTGDMSSLTRYGNMLEVSATATYHL
jgi:hypothetical protein